MVDTSDLVNGSLPITSTYNMAESLVDPEAEPDYPDFTQITAVCVTFIVLYFVVMVISLFGNAAVCITVVTNRKMQTVVNYYIVNLAVCDFMVGAFVLPMKLLELTAPASWKALNNTLCATMLYIQTVIVFASVLTLVATSIERYLAIVHPLESRMQQSKKRTIKILMLVWLFPIIGASPFLYYPCSAMETSLSSPYGTIDRLICRVEFPAEIRRIYYTGLFVCFYALPLVFISWTCIQITRCLLSTNVSGRDGNQRRQDMNRRKVAKMIMIVVLAFTICWTPYFLVTIITQYSSVNYMNQQNFFFTMLCINFFGFLNSSINPFIYAVMSTRFRVGFTRILHYILCAGSDGLDDVPVVTVGHNSSRRLNNGSSRRTLGRMSSRPRTRSLAQLGKYHRRMILLACGGPTQVSTESFPTDSNGPNNELGNGSHSPSVKAFKTQTSLPNGTHNVLMALSPDSNDNYPMKGMMTIGKPDFAHSFTSPCLTDPLMPQSMESTFNEFTCNSTKSYSVPCLEHRKTTWTTMLDEDSDTEQDEEENEEDDDDDVNGETRCSSSQSDVHGHLMWHPIDATNNPNESSNYGMHLDVNVKHNDTMTKTAGQQGQQGHDEHGHEFNIDTGSCIIVERGRRGENCHPQKTGHPYMTLKGRELLSAASQSSATPPSLPPSSLSAVASSLGSPSIWIGPLGFSSSSDGSRYQDVHPIEVSVSLSAGGRNNGQQQHHVIHSHGSHGIMKSAIGCDQLPLGSSSSSLGSSPSSIVTIVPMKPFMDSDL